MDKRKPLNIEIGLRLQVSRESADCTQELLAEKIALLSEAQQAVAGKVADNLLELAQISEREMCAV